MNGCQTTHVIFQNKLNIGADIFVPVKLVATRDRQVITEVIKATNRQTAVLPEALESLTPFHKELEDFYTIQESSRNLYDRIYYERRSKQYTIDNINPRNIVTLTGQIRSFIGMFLNEPHSHPHYYGGLLRSYEGRLFANDHKPAPYYASGIALLAVEQWFNSCPSARHLRSYKHQFLMLLRASISGQDLPKLSSNAISPYSLQIVDALRDPKRRDEECERAADVIGAALTKFGKSNTQQTDRFYRNPPHRLRAFTEQLVGAIPSSEPMQNDEKLRDRTVTVGDEQGLIIWYDEVRNYGFIKRDAGGDIFVHQSEIDAIPWHLRIADTVVRYKAVDNPKCPGLLMASKVELKST